MHVIAISTLRAFWARHPDAEIPLRPGYNDARVGRWQDPQAIKDRFAHASFVGNDRVVFNIAGNKYRLVAAIGYRSATIFIRFVGTHVEYDRIDVTSA